MSTTSRVGVFHTDLCTVTLSERDGRYTVETPNGVQFRRGDLDALMNIKPPTFRYGLCDVDHPTGLKYGAHAIIVDMLVCTEERKSCMPYRIEINDGFDRIDEMREWCRENVGLCAIAPLSTSKQDGWWWAYCAHFATRADAALFRLRWG